MIESRAPNGTSTKVKMMLAPPPRENPDRDEVFEFEIEQISEEALAFSHDLPPGGGF